MSPIQLFEIYIFTELWYVPIRRKQLGPSGITGEKKMHTLENSPQKKDNTKKKDNSQKMPISEHRKSFGRTQLVNFAFFPFSGAILECTHFSCYLWIQEIFWKYTVGIFLYICISQPIAFGVSFVSLSNLNLIGLFSTERSKRDLENKIIDGDLSMKRHSKCNRLYQPLNIGNIPSSE